MLSQIQEQVCMFASPSNNDALHALLEISLRLLSKLLTVEKAEGVMQNVGV